MIRCTSEAVSASCAGTANRALGVGEGEGPGVDVGGGVGPGLPPPPPPPQDASNIAAIVIKLVARIISAF
jgi:hypothetical protein